MPPKKKPAKRAAKPKPEPIRDHGDIVTAPAGTTEKDIVAQLTGVDQVPSLDDLSKAKAPPFDPHASREMPPGREFGGEPEAMMTTMVFIGIDRGGDFEDHVNSFINEAGKFELIYVHASIGKMNLDSHLDAIAEVADEIAPTTIDTDDDEAELDGNDDDYGEPI